MNEMHKEYTLMECVLILLDFLKKNNIEIENLKDNSRQMKALLSILDRQSVRKAYDVITFMEEAPGGFLIYHADNSEEIIYANKALLRIFQCDTMREFRKLTGNSFRGIVHPQDLYEVERSIKKQVAASQYDLDYVEYRIIRKDGDIRWIEDYGHFIYNEYVGNIFYVFLTDATEKHNCHVMEKEMLINERNRQEQKLQELTKNFDNEKRLINKEHLRRLEVINGLSINYESILYADLDENSILAYRLSSRTEVQFEKKFQPRKFTWYVSDYIKVWVHPEDKERLRKETSPGYIIKKLLKETTYYTNYRVIKDGEIQYLQLRIVNVGEKDRVSQIVMGYRRVDNELQKEIEQKQLLTEALNNANSAIVAKNTFLSNMSHDMRTPLNAIVGFTELAKKNIGNAEALQNYLGKVETACSQLLDLIDKVLDISWSESNEMYIEEEEFDIRDVLKEVNKILSSKAADKNITVSLDCKDVVHNIVCSDFDKLKQLILYLANNAVTYTEAQGKVLLSVKEQKLLANNHAIYRFEVEDTGIGIGKDFLKNIFEPFAREKNTTFSGVHGIGLGLTIAKNIVDAMGGTIEIKSAVGKGSTFIVTLRLKVQSHPHFNDNESNVSDKPLNKKILLVEDNEINLEIETEILKGMGFSVETALNGRIAVEKILNSKPGDYDLILTDIQMPVMDGWQAAKSIRSLENSELAGIPIIALSANAFEKDIQTSMESGMNAHLTKPINVSQLIKAIEDII